MLFSLPRGAEALPHCASNPNGIDAALLTAASEGAALLVDLPDHLKDDGTQDLHDWRVGVAATFEPAIRRLFPDLLPEVYKTEARRHHQRIGDHHPLHQDPRYRDPFFWGYTREGATELRYSPDLGKSGFLMAGPETMWLMAGRSVLPPEITGGIGGPWHETGMPIDGVERHLTMGGFVLTKAAKTPDQSNRILTSQT